MGKQVGRWKGMDKKTLMVGKQRVASLAQTDPACESRLTPQTLLRCHCKFTLRNNKLGKYRGETFNEESLN